MCQDGEAKVWVKIAVFSRVSENEPLRLEAKGRPLMLARIGGNIFVTDALCTHEEADLSLAMLLDVVITCPLHQAKFDLRNSIVLEGPNGTDPNTISNLRTYSVKVESDEIWADI